MIDPTPTCFDAYHDKFEKKIELLLAKIKLLECCPDYQRDGLWCDDMDKIEKALEEVKT